MIKTRRRPRAALRAVENLLARALVSRTGVSCIGRIKLHGFPRISAAPQSVIELHDGVVLNSSWRTNTLMGGHPVTLRTLHPDAKIVIGQDAGLSTCAISALNTITIGKRVLVGAGVVITDNDHHRLDVLPDQRRSAGLPPRSQRDSIEIGDNVFIGARAMILKGVTIGDGATIGAGSVVTHNVPPGVTVAGNPAQQVARR